MRIITIASFLFLLLNSCASKKELNKSVEFIITYQYVVDNSFINLLITNKSESNYYLPILQSFENERLEFILPSEENNFFCIYKVFTSSANKELEWFSDNCYAESVIDQEREKLHQLWKKKKESIEAKDLILLKSGESIKIKIPIHLNLKVTDVCSWELKNYRSEKELSIAINYLKKDTQLTAKFLNTKVIEDLKNSGYELYDK